MKVKGFDLTHLFSIAGLIALAGVWSANSFGPMMVLISGAVLMLAVMSSIHHAEVIAKRVGPSLGALILALAVTVIEVGLIVSMMSNDTPNSAVVARDTVFSAVIIVTNGIAGFCFLLGGFRHLELEFRVEGASSLLAVLATLVGITMILPNYTTSTPGPTYSTVQLIFASGASLLLYAALLISQTVTHKDYFAVDAPLAEAVRPTRGAALLSGASLVISLIVVIGLAKALSPSIEAGLDSIGAPKAAVGIVIALLVLLPEAGAALGAARANQLQTSLNLALGSGAASVALTIPVIAAFSILTHRNVSLGLDAKATAFLVLTFIVSGLTMATGKTTFLKGVVHLILLFAYIVLSFIP